MTNATIGFLNATRDLLMYYHAHYPHFYFTLYVDVISTSRVMRIGIKANPCKEEFKHCPSQVAYIEHNLAYYDKQLLAVDTTTYMPVQIAALKDKCDAEFKTLPNRLTGKRVINA